ncbi:6-phosphofructokinase 3, partial [Tetrabaena socialis]
HAVICVAEGAGQDLMTTAASASASAANSSAAANASEAASAAAAYGTPAFQSHLVQRDHLGNPLLRDIGVYLRTRLKLHFRGSVEVRYIDPTYTVRTTPCNSLDHIYARVLAHNAVDAAFSGGCNSSLALLLLLAACLISISLYVSRDSLALVARLLGLAAVALRDNPAILALVMLLKLALAGATALLLLAAAVVGAAGDVVANPLRGGNPRCATPAGAPVTCCAWAPSAALPAYLPMAGVALTWTLALLFELKVYVVSGCVAQVWRR